MDLKKIENKPQLIKRKKKVLKDLDNLIKGYMDSPDEEQYKQAANLVYWFKDFKRYTLEKSQFNPNRLLRYSKGQIIKVNLGFNVGNEEGGMHYAIVIDNRNKKSSGLVTIVPLTSVKFDKRGKIKNYNENYDVFLGTEVYDRLYEKAKERFEIAQNQLQEFEKLEKTMYQMLVNRYGVDIRDLISEDGTEDTLITEEVFQHLLKSYRQLKSPFKSYVGSIKDNYCDISNASERRGDIKEKLQNYIIKNKKEQETLREAILGCTSGIEEVHKTLDILKKQLKKSKK